MTKEMTVRDLVAFLQKLDQNLPVVRSQWSEFILLNEDDINVERLSLPRPDGWVHEYREDKPSQEYLVLP